MRRYVALALLISILIGMPIVAMLLTQSKGYGLESFTLEVWRLNGLILWVVCALNLLNMVQQDDLEEDYKRINEGNIAVGIYRGLEFFSLVVAAALLISKI